MMMMMMMMIPEGAAMTAEAGRLPLLMRPVELLVAAAEEVAGEEELRSA